MKAAWYETQGPADGVLRVGDMPDPQLTLLAIHSELVDTPDLPEPVCKGDCERQVICRGLRQGSSSTPQ